MTRNNWQVQWHHHGSLSSFVWKIWSFYSAMNEWVLWFFSYMLSLVMKPYQQLSKVLNSLKAESKTGISLYLQFRRQRFRELSSIALKKSCNVVQGHEASSLFFWDSSSRPYLTIFLSLTAKLLHKFVACITWLTNSMSRFRNLYIIKAYNEFIVL